MKKTSLFIQLFILTTLTMAQTDSKYFVDENNVAIKGYDVVEYANQNAAVQGSSNFASENDGAIWYFSSAENKTTFEGNPSKYLPAYGGYCAFAVAAKNAKVPTDPETFKYYNGQLHLFFNDLWDGQKFNTIVPWNADEVNMKKTAEANWKAMD